MQLAAKGLVKQYSGRTVVSAVNLDVQPGEVVGLLGPNGAGKTTTFYMMVGLVAPSGGEVYLDDKVITRLPMHQRARLGIGYLPQESSVFRKLTVEENLLAILETLSLSKTEKAERLQSLMGELNVTHLAHNKAYTLSGGGIPQGRNHPCIDSRPEIPAPRRAVCRNRSDRRAGYSKDCGTIENQGNRRSHHRPQRA